MGKIIKTQHTPGPWRIGYYRPADGDEALAVWSESIKEGEKGHPVCLVSTVKKMDERDEANARLIAAAPELLEACKELVHSLEWEVKRSGTTYFGFEAAKAAIKKAEVTL